MSFNEQFGLSNVDSFLFLFFVCFVCSSGTCHVLISSAVYRSYKFYRSLVLGGGVQRSYPNKETTFIV